MTELQEDNPMHMFNLLPNLRDLIKELSEDLESELVGRYGDTPNQYPNEKRRFNRDMDPVYKAKAALVPLTKLCEMIENGEL